MNNSTTRPLALLLLTLVAVVGCERSLQWHGTDVSGVLPDLAFELVNEEGSPVTAAEYRGRVTLLYFGFTNCPGICPATLGQLAAAIDALGEEAQALQVLLVTVDPARDTPAALREYTAQFGPWLHGLTGPEEQLHTLNRAYKVDFAALGADTSGAYDVAHSNAVFAFDAEGRCRLLIRDTADTPAVLADLRQLVRTGTALSARG